MKVGTRAPQLCRYNMFVRSVINIGHIHLYIKCTVSPCPVSLVIQCHVQSAIARLFTHIYDMTIVGEVRVGEFKV